MARQFNPGQIQTGSLFNISSSYALTASYVLNAVSSSFSSTASFVRTSQTASYVLNAVSSSFASTASFVNPLTQTVRINGALIQTGSHAEGQGTNASGSYSHAEGASTTATGDYSHAEGQGTTATGDSSHAEGSSTVALGAYSHAEGASTTAQGQSSHAEGEQTVAEGYGSHVEGYNTYTLGSYSHAEGIFSGAVGGYSHAEGSNTVALGAYSHAEGSSTTATGDASHAEGQGTIASGSYQHVQGAYNLSSSAQSAFIVGNGTADGARSNLIFASGSQVQITGSVIATAGFTGSLQGTASFATTASFAVSASRAVSSSFATTASYLNTLNQNLTFNGNLTLNGTASISYLNVSYESASVIYSSGSNQFGDAANDTQTLYGSVIIPTGNVGIGTNSPQSILDVITPEFGYASFAKQMTTGVYTGIHFGYREPNNLYRKSAIVFERTDLTEVNAQGKVHILNGPQSGAGSATLSDAKLTINEAGNIGIGTTTPLLKFQIVGSTSAFPATSSTTQTGGLLRLQNIDSNGILDIGGNAGSGFWLQTTNATTLAANYSLLLNPNGGNVGIGTTTPEYKLDVVGESRISGSLRINNGFINLTSTNNTYYQLGFQSGVDFSIYNSNYGRTDLYINQSTSNVGIGTTTPNAKLDVSGSARITDSLTVTGSLIVSGSGTFTGTQIISGSLIFDTPTSPAFNGEIVRFGSGTLTTGQLYFLSSSGTWSLANANSTGSSTGMLGIATGTSPTTAGLLVRGYAASSSYTTATGSIVYAATSSGLMTTTSPSSSNHVVRVVGYVTTIPNTIYFAPDPTFITLA